LEPDGSAREYSDLTHQEWPDGGVVGLNESKRASFEQLGLGVGFVEFVEFVGFGEFEEAVKVLKDGERELLIEGDALGIMDRRFTPASSFDATIAASWSSFCSESSSTVSPWAFGSRERGRLVPEISSERSGTD